MGVVKATGEAQGRRERKKQRTRRALIEAAYLLFERQGYERTTVAQIAEMADVSSATFFNHFPAKEDLLFAEGQLLLEEGLRVIAAGHSDATPVEVLAEAMRHMMRAARGTARDPASAREQVRVRLLMSEPALQAATLQRLFEAQRQLAHALQRAYPDQLDDLTAATLVGAVAGAILAAADVSLRQANSTQSALDMAFHYAINSTLHTLRTAQDHHTIMPPSHRPVGGNVGGRD